MPMVTPNSEEFCPGATGAWSIVTISATSPYNTEEAPEPDWPRLYAAILKLKPKHQTIITLRFFENLRYEQIAQILGVKEATLRVTLHRILSKLRKHLLTVFDGEMENV